MKEARAEVWQKRYRRAYTRGGKLYDTMKLASFCSKISVTHADSKSGRKAHLLFFFLFYTPVIKLQQILDLGLDTQRSSGGQGHSR